MQPPELPGNEAERLQTLYSLDILDTESEERFDRITRLARRLFDVPISLVSLVDRDRQWFKSCFGLDACETPRDISFCGHAILGDQLFIVEDAAQDPRFADNPLVTGPPGIRFYAGYPLTHKDGSRLGTLCLIDKRPRSLSADDREALADLAAMVEKELMVVQLATLDDLTRISNRRGFKLLANKSLQLCARGGVPATLVFIDLNGFKQINDRFGHNEGDRALVVFSVALKASFRQSDIFARLGGDEFVVLLSNTPPDKARQSIARLETHLGRLNAQQPLGYELAFSAGLLAVDFTGDFSVTTLLDRADELMYAQKLNEPR